MDDGLRKGAVGVLYAGGQFGQAGEQIRNRLASIDIAQKRVTSFDPNADELVRALAAGNGRLFAGGYFSTIGGEPRKSFAGFGILDCANVAGGTGLPGSSCDDGQTTTENDTWTNGCTCTGDLITPVPERQHAMGLRAWPNPPAMCSDWTSAWTR
jgi:hypothetical protein